MIGEIVSKEASLTCNHVLVTRCLVGQDCTFVSLSSGQAGTAMHFFTPNPEGDGELFGMIRDLPVVSPGEPL
ncbi:hypothetical protein KKF84_09450, partial [Myxococcota bacterium]|nr:hypothetical protein [Myxococcota bacterium]